MPKDSTIQLYEQQLKLIDGLDIKDYDDVYDKLKEMKTKKGCNISNSMIKNTICAIIWKLKNEKGNEKLIRQYGYILAHLKNQANKKELNHKNNLEKIPDWDYIIKTRDNLTDPRKRLILNLYTMVAPRRIKDYQLMKIAYKMTDTKDDNFNYYVVSKKIFIFNKYKTEDAFKQQIIKCPPELSKFINGYIKYNNLANGSLLLGINNRLQLNYILKKVIGCSVDGLRHSYINNQYKQFNIPSSEFMEKLATDMGHSLQTHLRYRKF